MKKWVFHSDSVLMVWTELASNIQDFVASIRTFVLLVKLSLYLSVMELTVTNELLENVEQAGQTLNLNFHLSSAVCL